MNKKKKKTVKKTNNEQIQRNQMVNMIVNTN
jgi:hypothetical protein